MKLKRIWTALLILVVCGNAFSQERDSLIASKYRPGFFTGFFTGLVLPYKPWIPRHDRFIIDIKYNDLTQSPDLKVFNTKWNSIGVDIQWMFDLPMDSKGISSFGIGVGYDFGKFVYNRDLVVSEGNQYDFTDSFNADKAILRTHTFFVPVEFRIRSLGRKYFNFHIGSNVGYRFGNNKEYIDNVTIKTKTKGMSNFENLYVDVHARIGYKSWAVIVAANMLPIFRNTTDKTYPISLGLSISLF